jgi:uncharacterized protein YutE (UPF0331/DUF86 family)
MTPSSIDRAIVRRHLLALDQALARLERHASVPLSTFEADLDLQWLVERGLLVAIQNVLDVATHLAASAGRDVRDYTSSIDVLADLAVLPRDFAQRIRPMAGFRNVLVHAYLTLDAVRVHDVLSTKLTELRRFAQLVEAHLDGSVGA